MSKLEFLLLWVLGGNILDSGLRYEDAGSCYAAAQNSGKDLQEIGLAPPKFTCVPVAENKELKLLVPEQQGSRFPLSKVIRFSSSTFLRPLMDTHYHIHDLLHWSSIHLWHQQYHWDILRLLIGHEDYA